jgi:hypothetical protein
MSHVGTGHVISMGAMVIFVVFQAYSLQELLHIMRYGKTLIMFMNFIPSMWKSVNNNYINITVFHC